MRIISSQDLFESYMSDLDEATAMAKRGHDEAPIRQRIAQSTGGGKAADRATALERRLTFGSRDNPAARSRYAQAQRGDFRRTTSSNQNTLLGYGFKSNDPKVKAKQAARGAQRSALTPKEKQQLNREEFELWVNSLVNEGYDLSEYTWDDVYEIYETYSDYLTVQAFLIGEGYADSIQESDYMIENMDEDLIEEILEEGYKKLPVAKMMGQAVRKGVRSNLVVAKIHPALRDDAIEGLEKTKSDIKKMMRVAGRHSLVKGKGRIRGEGQALLNRLRGEAKRGE